MIKVSIQQPSLAKYRVPVFKELANRKGIQLKLHFGERIGVPNVEPSGFTGVKSKLYRKTFAGIPAYWHSAQWNLATKKHSDVLFLTWNIQYLSLIPSLLRAKANNVKTILWGHGYSKKETKIKYKVRKTIGRLATALLFYNHSTADYYVKDGMSAERVFVAPNSLSQSEIQASRERWLAEPRILSDFRNEFRLLGPNILFVSRLDPQNQLELLINCIRNIKTDYPNVALNVVGKGEEEKTRLAKIVDSMDLKENVRFLGPIYDENKIAPWFLTADVFCYPANIGLSLFHAFGYGVPVVTSDKTSAQNPEIDAFRDRYNGLFFKHDSIEDLEKQLRVLIVDSELRDRMSLNALSTVTNDFNVVRMVDGMVDAIQYCLK